MLMAAYEEVVTLTKGEALRARAASEVHEQVKSEQEVIRCMHEEIVIGLRKTNEVAYGQLAVTQLELKKALVEAEIFYLRFESVSVKLETAQTIQDIEAAVEA